MAGDQDGQRNLTKKNKVLIVWICFLFLLTLINAMFVFMQGILTYVDPSLFDDGTILDQIFNFVALLVYPLKDFLIAISFSSLYLYQGLNESKKRKVKGRNIKK
jgi:phosphoglycerol transferase MdoB-like AlkP superfamily enzyme